MRPATTSEFLALGTVALFLTPIVARGQGVHVLLERLRNDPDGLARALFALEPGAPESWFGFLHFLTQPVAGMLLALGLMVGWGMIVAESLVNSPPRRDLVLFTGVAMVFGSFSAVNSHADLPRALEARLERHLREPDGAELRRGCAALGEFVPVGAGRMDAPDRSCVLTTTGAVVIPRGALRGQNPASADAAP